MAKNLTDIIKKVRTALRGEEVRGSIADGLEYCGQVVEGERDSAKAAADRAEAAAESAEAAATQGVLNAVDSTLTLSGKAADAKATGAAVDKEKERASKSENALEDKKADKTDLDTERKRIDVLNEGGLNLKDDVIDTSIKAWLTEHPEATTTVQDGSIGYEKLSESFKKQIISIISEKNGDISELIKTALKNNVHLRICDSNITLSKTLSFEDLKNVTLEFINSKATFLYDHDKSAENQVFLQFENCKNVYIKGLEVTTDFSEENGEDLDVQELYLNNLYAIWFGSVENGKIENCTISQFTDALSINYSKNISVCGCTIYNVGQEPAVFRNCARCEMHRCEAYWYGGDGTIVKHFDSYDLSGFVYAENYLHDGKVVTTRTGNIICGGGFTSNVEGNAEIKRDPEYIVVKNNTFIDTEYGVLMAGGSHIIVDGNFIKSKQKEDGNYYTYAALGLDYSAYNLPETQKYSDIKFIDNTVEQASRGIYITKKSTENVVITHEDILISGNIIKNCKNEAIETYASLIYGNIFENVQIISIFDSIFLGNKVVGASFLQNQWCRLQANDSDVICNKLEMNGLYLDVRNTKDVSISYNTIDTMEIFRIEWTAGHVYITDNVYFSNPKYRLLNNPEKYIIINGEPYQANLINDEYYSYVKRNGVVEVNFISSKSIALTTSKILLGTLPDGYRPITTTRHILYTNPSSGAIGKIARIEVNTSGEVTAIASENVSGAPIRGSITFLPA